MMDAHPYSVIPAKAGIHSISTSRAMLPALQKFRGSRLSPG